jgi:CRISPR-associated endonuclease/helicase Cas3
MIISHIRKNANGFEMQSNKDHSKGVASLAEQFAKTIGFGKWAWVMGMLHDKGKEQDAFQTHIKRAAGVEDGEPGKVEHAYVGALLAKKQYPITFPFLSWAIMCHHTGLYDYTYFEKKMKEMQIPKGISCSEFNSVLTFPSLYQKLLDGGKKDFYCWNHLQRVLFSCLVDADYLNTETFMKPESSRLRGSHTPLTDLLPLLEKKLSSFHSDTPVNVIRKEILDQCVGESECEKGFYSMTVPTGGGKTLTSIAWALHHAIHNGQQRIIVAIPYTSIIVQTAQTFRDIFGDENVLEHHSNVDIKFDESDEKNQKLKLATENWDYPIIVTTNVQLFESLYSNRTSHCRKLHNICNSVIILDEVQTLQTDFLQPIIDVLKAYNKCFNTSVLFTTASMPVLSKDAIRINGLDGIDSIQELIPKEMNLQSRLKRVDIEFDKSSCSYDEIAKRLCREKRVLCIVNTRRDAREIFIRLPEEGVKIHLSRMMCPAHVMAEIDKIRETLKNDKCDIIRVVSTQLIEAGVDIDFPCVYRQMAGLDSILQAAGRCNREGKLSKGMTHVFKIKGRKDYGFVCQTRQATENVITDDYQSTKAMSDYFNQLYSRVVTFDKKRIGEELNNPLEMMFETASDLFQLIEDNGINVIVNYGNALQLIAKLKEEGPSYLLMKKLNQYTVNVREKDFKELFAEGSIKEIIEGVFYLNNPSQYKDDIGITMENTWLEETLIK